ncbi:MAG: 2-polyprenylphenol 6-hydroxylase, partial [Proteobacteria bacterium]|nr:2-polyprenylphenol 6-hydroxylase [Pseudomonadota bacterium]
TLILNRSWEFFFKQIFRDGFFHADMHPGNVFIDPAGNIAVVDFGIMGRLSPESRYYLAEMIRSFVRKDYVRAAEVHFEAGYVPKDKSVALFAQALRSVAEPIFGLPQSEISVAKLLSQLFKITRQFEMETQPQLLMLQKTLMMAEGMARTLDPEVNIWNLAGPHVESWTKAELGVEGRLRHLAKDIRHFLSRISDLVSLAEESLKNNKKSK